MKGMIDISNERYVDMKKSKDVCNMIFGFWVNQRHSCRRRPPLPQLVVSGQTLFSFRFKMMADISTQLCLNWCPIRDTWIQCDKWSSGTQFTRWAPLLTQLQRGLTSACAQPLSSAVCGGDQVAPGGLYSISNIFRATGEKLLNYSFKNSQNYLLKII